MLAIITCHFNFANYVRPQQNLHRFVLQMRSFGYPVFGVETFLPDHPPFTRGWENWKQIAIDVDQIMFQKEALLNMAEKTVPAGFDKIAWIDCDIWFQNLTWYALAGKLLDEFNVVQLFEECFFCSPNGRPFKRRSSFFLPGESHPGFAWAARRDFWSICAGLYPGAVVGGGDNIAARAFAGMPLWDRATGANKSQYQQWQQGVVKWADTKFSFVPGSIYHEWHGSVKDRAYGKRLDLIKDFDLTKLLAIADNGLPRWTASAPDSLKNNVRNYFLNRKEDG